MRFLQRHPPQMKWPVADASYQFYPYILGLTGFFLLLEISFFIQMNSFYFSDFSYITQHISIPLTILPEIMVLVLIQLAIHVCYSLLIFILTLGITNLIQSLRIYNLQLAISLFFLCLLTILVANLYLYPNSKYAELISVVFFLPMITKLSLNVLITLVIIIGGISLIGWSKYLLKLSFINQLTAIILIIFTSLIFFESTPIKNSSRNVNKPNIFIVGIDSVRPDFLHFFGHAIETPFIDSFLKESIIFSDAITPLARTYPSWMGILSGEHPKKINIRSNLAMPETTVFSNNIGFILQQQGYETIYATDETRFSNIDASYGFNKIVTPKMGLNDFLLGTFNDFPLSNLLINTPLGKWLFPYSYGNRAVYTFYQPDSFLNLVSPVLFEIKNKPLFLAIHFCLPHHPYLWSSYYGSNDLATIIPRYSASITRVDAQLKNFFKLLEQAQLLDNALVILLSDHGEALELPGDRITEESLFFSTQSKKIPKFYPPSLDNEAVNRSAGHGTDVLGLSQYHSLLSFRFYGKDKKVPAVLAGIVPLTDIKATLLDYLQLDYLQLDYLQLDYLQLSPDSQNSLLPRINGKKIIADRHIFIESDFSTAAIRTLYPEAHRVMLEGIELFEINPKNSRLTVKPEMMQKIIASKQYADIYKNWMLALYPQSTKVRMPILVNLKTGEWTNDLNSSLALNAPVNLMLKELKTFYGNELTSFSKE